MLCDPTGGHFARAWAAGLNSASGAWRRLPAQRQRLLIRGAAVGVSAATQLVAQRAARRRWKRAKCADRIGDPGRECTDLLLLLNTTAFALQLVTEGRLTAWGLKDNERILAGETWRLLTPIFLHAGPAHILFNMMALHSAGPVVEKLVGRDRFLATYWMGGLVGCLSSLCFTRERSLGASGAIMGLEGALMIYFARHNWLHNDEKDSVLSSILVNIGWNFTYGIFHPDIGNWGHLGGLVGGAAAAMVLGPNYHIEWLPRRVEKRIGTPRAKWVGGRLAELHTRAQVFNARLVDWPALPLFRAPPKLIYWEGPAQPRN